MNIAPPLFESVSASAEVPAESANTSLFPALAFRRLDLHRMPGIDQRFVLDDLCAGINVIYGPNGCGKTRSAAAMNLALWPRGAGGAPRQVSIDAAFDIGSVRWRVELDAGTVRYRRDGAEVDEPPALLPPVDNRDRYNLPLHELLSEDKSQFAQLIVRETAGGYDVPQAAAMLGFKATASTARAAAELKGAKHALDEARRKQRSVQEEADTLEELQSRKRDAQAAASRAALLRNALKLVEAQQAWEFAQAQVEHFPPALKSLSGSEWKTYQQYSKDLADARDQKERAEDDRARAEKADADGRLPEAGVPGEVLPALSGLSSKINRSSLELRNHRAEKEKALAARANARSRIAPALSDEALSRIVASDLQPFADLARHAETVHAGLRAEAEVKAWLGDSLTRVASPSEIQALQEGIGNLQRWLREPRPAMKAPAGPSADPVLKMLVWIAAGVLALVAIALAAAVHVGWGLLIIPAAALGCVMVVRSKREPTASLAPATPLHEVHEREFSRLPLPQPASWTAEEVQTLLQTLISDFAAKQIDAKGAGRWNALEPRRKELLRQREELQQLRSRLGEQLGVAPKLDESPMFALVSNVIAWQEADRQVAQATAAETTAAAVHDADMAFARSMLAPFGYSIGDNPTEVAAAAQDLGRRAETFQKARIAKEAAADAARVAEQRIVDLESRILKLFKDAGIAPDEVRTLEDFCNQHPDYCKAVKQADLARHVRDQAAVALREHEELKNISAEDLRQQLSDAEATARRLDSINQQIGGILAKIEQAKKSDTVESSLARVGAEEDALRERRDVDCAAVAGWALAQYIKRESNDRQRPAVFRRARELFAMVTQGKYRLDLDDSAGGSSLPTFRATDNSTNIAHPLNELSGATRLQLLLSVRVAFVEQQERGARLPIFIDEALANSDEHRARTIIEAAIELARSGRQVFYFTAQIDEVEKWKRFLHGAPEVTHRLVDLAAVRGLAENERLPMPQTLPPAPVTVPPPADGMTYESYGELLKVPALDLWGVTVGGIHLWHLLDDGQTLFQFLRRGPSTWGQVRELRAASRSRGATGLFAGLDDACRRAEAAADAISAMTAGWRVGRGRKINRAVLLDSGAITSTFADSVCTLAQELEFDPARLLASLEARTIRGFRNQGIVELRAYLVEQRYLDERPKLTRDEIRTRMLAAVADAICSGLIEPVRIDSYLDRWCIDLPDETSSSDLSASS